LESYLTPYQHCLLCGHQCGADRTVAPTGACGLGTDPLLASAGPHYGEEPELVGRHGSGTIFLAGCNLACRFCQNWEISQLRQGEPAGVDNLAGVMLRLERMGCHNVNLVTPTPWTPTLMEAVRRARDRGLAVPVVYNCGGYESPDALALCDGLVDVYMPDAKYSDGELAEACSGAPDYPDVNRAALREMHRQVGDLEVSGGVARKGLLVRHLVLPGQPRNTREVLEFIAAEISADTYVNLMDQYRPCYLAYALPGLDRRPTLKEYTAALAAARQLGLYRGFTA